MRKLILAVLAATAVVPTLAAAQSAAEVRHDRHELQRDRAELRQDRARGDWGDVRHDRHEIRGDRHEMRGDWHDYRQAHRGVYRRPAYRGPRGYAYRPIAVGHRFAPGYYERRYWINDPWRYRLARPAGYQRWVRYGNDVALVNLRNGRVTAVHRGFFW